MYESYFDQLRDECFLRNRTTRTANAHISNITYFFKYTGKHPDELTLEDARNHLIALIYSSGLRVREAVNLAPSNIYMSTIGFLL